MVSRGFRMKGKAAKKDHKITLSEPAITIPGDAIISLRMELSNLLGKKLAAGVVAEVNS